MRVYEFCKQHDVPSKDAIAWLKEAGIPVGNHMSVLTQEAEQFLIKKLNLKKEKSDQKVVSSVEKLQGEQEINKSPTNKPEQAPKGPAVALQPNLLDLEKKQQASSVQNVSTTQKR